MKCRSASMFFLFILFTLFSYVVLAAEGTDKAEQKMTKALQRRDKWRPAPPPPKLKPDAVFFLEMLSKMPARLRVRVLHTRYFASFYPIGAERVIIPEHLPAGYSTRCRQALYIWRLAILLAKELIKSETRENSQVLQHALAQHFVNLAFQVNRVLCEDSKAGVDSLQQSMIDVSCVKDVKVPLPDFSKLEGGEKKLIRTNRPIISQPLTTYNVAAFSSLKDLYKDMWSYFCTVYYDKEIKVTRRQEYLKKTIIKLDLENSESESTHCQLGQWRCAKKVSVAGPLPEKVVSGTYPKKVLKMQMCHSEWVEHGLYSLFRKALYQGLILGKGEASQVYLALAKMRRDYLLLLRPMQMMDVETMDVITIVMSMFMGQLPPLLKDKPESAVHISCYKNTERLFQRIQDGSRKLAMLLGNKSLATGDQVDVDGSKATVSISQGFSVLSLQLEGIEASDMGNVDQTLDYYFPGLRVNAQAR